MSLADTVQAKEEKGCVVIVVKFSHSTQSHFEKHKITHAQPGYEGGHDHCIFQFLKHRSNFDFARTNAHRFAYSNVVLNLCEEPYNEAEVKRTSPATAVVHSTDLDSDKCLLCVASRPAIQLNE